MSKFERITGELIGYDYKRMDHSSSQSDFMKELDKLENLIALLVRRSLLQLVLHVLSASEYFQVEKRITVFTCL